MKNNTIYNEPKNQALAWFCERYTNIKKEISPALLGCFALTGRKSYAVKLLYEELECFQLKPCRGLKINGPMGRAIWVENGDILKIIELGRALEVDYALSWNGYVDLRPEQVPLISKAADI